MRSRSSRDCGAHCVAHEVSNMAVLQKGRVFGEQRTLFRIFNVRFDSYQPLFARLVEEIEHHPQRIDVSALGKLRSSQNAAETTGNLLQHMHWICREHCSERRTANNDKLGRLHENSHRPLFHHEASQDRAEDNEYSDDCKHLASSSGRPCRFVDTTPELSAIDLRRAELPAVNRQVEVPFLEAPGNIGRVWLAFPFGP